MRKTLSRKKAIIFFTALFLLTIGVTLFLLGADKKKLGIKSLSAITKVSSFLPITNDEKKELGVVNELVTALTEKNGKTWTFMVFLQNNMELRPGGGFLGQYAIIKIKDGEVISTFLEDANLLDQRISAKITPPYPFARKMQIKKWKFRDSNWSPDFPTNVEKAKYFYRLSGRGGEFDGFVAVNSDVLSDVLKLTGPIVVPGYSETFTSENVVLKLEEKVEKAYILNPDIDTQNRKAIMKTMAPLIVEKLTSLSNITKLAELVHEEFKKKNLMVNFSDSRLQASAKSVFWTGEFAQDWGSDYLMLVDANMGALKTDYYMQREIKYDIDLTAEKPLVNLTILYKNTAPYGDWRTSDYHAYSRIYVPKGATLLERKMVGAPIVGEDLGKTYIGFFVDVLMRGETQAEIKYELPADFPRDDYRLLIQKQSGMREVPVKVHLKTAKGEFNQEQNMTNDLKFEFQEQ